MSRLGIWSSCTSTCFVTRLPTMNLKSYTGLNPYDDDDKEERAGGKKDNTVVIVVGTVVGMAVMFGLAWSRA
jgi:hypothetical protein